MCFPLIAGVSPGAPRWPDKAVLKYRQSTVSKQSEKERECCSGNSSGKGRDLAAVLHLENVTGAASEHRLGPCSLAGCVAASFTASGHSGTLGTQSQSQQAPWEAPGEMPQEQYTHHRTTMPSSEGPQVYKVGIYGWRKRCLYFFVLLLMILILVNLAMTIWILKVMNFTIDGMGNLRITDKGLKLEGDSEFLQPLYAKEIQSRPGNALYFKSARNVTVNILNDQTKVLTQLITGPKAVEAYGKKFEVKTVSGKLLFSADSKEVVVGAERLRVLGAEGTVFPKSIETPNVRADPFKELSKAHETEQRGRGCELFIGGRKFNLCWHHVTEPNSYLRLSSLNFEWTQNVTVIKTAHGRRQEIMCLVKQAAPARRIYNTSIH
uniref:Sarcoglycan delta n=1 Tax=Ailuropoda melanoleuca TaxID=9646 RepID=A0A7N5JZK2_AILME